VSARRARGARLRAALGLVAALGPTPALAPPAGAAAGAPAASAAPQAAGAELAASRVFVRRLIASGRATASVERRASDPFGGSARTVRGRIALEPPDRARLDLGPGGESVTLRADGGEWLQPALGQMLRLRPAAAAAALRWWSLLLPGAGARFGERRVGAREYAVVARDGAAGDTAWVTLDAAGLPFVLRFRDAAGEPVEVRLTGWSFGPPRGARAFTLRAPPGTVVVELP